MRVLLVEDDLISRARHYPDAESRRSRGGTDRKRGGSARTAAAL